MRLLADWRNSRGMAAHERGDIPRAIALYEKAAATDPTWSVPWYNLGLVFKEQRDWRRSLQCNQEAVRRGSTNEAAWWNLGIAATALSEWEEARRAWTSYGIELPTGTGEIAGDFGYTPIRINPEYDGEVVWTQRIDPARAIIRSVPLPESRHRHGDLLLHDGAPNGYRMLRGREVSVFDELELLSPSQLGTFEATVEVGSVADLAALEDVFREAGGAAEDWSSIRYICQSCSEGRPHEGHDLGELHAAGERRIGIAACSLGTTADLLDRWAKDRGAVWSGNVTTLLSPSAAV
jgi:hypothetical protein